MEEPLSIERGQLKSIPIFFQYIKRAAITRATNENDGFEVDLGEAKETGICVERRKCSGLKQLTVVNVLNFGNLNILLNGQETVDSFFNLNYSHAIIGAWEGVLKVLAVMTTILVYANYRIMKFFDIWITYKVKHAKCFNLGLPYNRTY